VTIREFWKHLFSGIWNTYVACLWGTWHMLVVRTGIMGTR
jgi:hypothetical protein